MTERVAWSPDDGTLTDWAYAAIVEEQGGTIYGITHDGETFAEKVGLIRSYASLENAAGSTFVPFALGQEADEVGAQMRLSTYKERSPDYYYQLSHKIDHRFRIRDFMGSGQRLEVDQSFCFTETSNSPRHETAGIASAGRFYPTLDFEASSVKDPDAEAIMALRFDFWIEPDLGPGGRRRSLRINPLGEIKDSIIDWFNAEDTHRKVPQQAGLFRDRDHSALTRPFRVGGLFNPPGAQIFENAEKPLVYEVNGEGILHGGRDGWDNIHIWGKSDHGLVSTPGMPFGMHLHWRWSAAATDLTSMFLGDFSFALDMLSEDMFRSPELAGRGPNNTVVPGGPLIDPRNPDTDLRVAWVTRETADAYAARTAESETDFARLFEEIATRPARVADGVEGMVAIISIVVRRKQRDRSWRGTVFPHGLFFPHAYDVGLVAEGMLSAAGAYEPQYLSTTPRRTWKRNPS